MKLAAVDVHYGEDRAVAACLVFDGWQASDGLAYWTAVVDELAPYQPGQFYLRELPCLMAVLKRATLSFDVIVIDGYVWLSAEGRPGLGAILFDELGGTTPIVGIAKNPFQGARFARSVLRGTSRKPLYVTTMGLPVDEAVRGVRRMHGPDRMPTLLKEVDHLARGLDGS